MKERPLNFNQNNDPTLVVVDEKTKKEIVKSCSDIGFAASYLKSLVEKDKLEEGMKETMTSLIDTYTQEVCKNLGYETTLKKKQDDLRREIRELNCENRELRTQLGQKVTVEDCREKMKLIADTFQYWSKHYGFGWVHDLKFNDYGMIEATISTRAERRHRTEEEESAYKRMVDYGFTYGGRDGDDLCLECTENNFQLLIKFFHEFSPDMHYRKADIWNYGDIPIIRSVEVILRDITPIEKYIDEYLAFRKVEEEAWKKRQE